MIFKNCRDCDSTSMEMCLLIKKCPYWAEKPEDRQKKEKEDK